MSSFLHSKNSLGVTNIRAKPSNVLQGKSNLTISTIYDPYNLMNGLQGSGKFTDNVFRSSLRKEMISPKISQKSFVSRTPGGASGTTECLSSRSLKTEMVSPRVKKSPLGITKLNSVAMKSKENDPLRLKKNVNQIIKKKPKYAYQGNILRESNREVTEPIYPVGKKAYSQFKGSFLTEQDSFTSDFTCPTMDINQQLKTIFNAGIEELDEDSAMDFSIPEEEIHVDHLMYKTSNIPYVMMGK